MHSSAFGAAAWMVLRSFSSPARCSLPTFERYSFTVRGGRFIIAGSGYQHLVVAAVRILFVGAKRRYAPESGALIERDRVCLVDPGLEPQQSDAALSRVLGEPVQDPLRIAAPPECRPHVHALQLSILGSEELHAAAGGRSPRLAQQEERDTLREQLVHAVAVPAL